MFKTVLTTVQDLDATKATWTALLGEPTNDTPYYVGWTFDDHEVGLTPAGDQPPAGPTSYWHTDDMAASIAAVVAAGGTQQQEPQDVGGGRLVGLVDDNEGHTIGLIQDPS